jgi:hypothetical protein
MRSDVGFAIEAVRVKSRDTGESMYKRKTERSATSDTYSNADDGELGNSYFSFT